MFSTSSPTYPASVRLVASAIVNGTFRKRASDWARSVLPEPVGPMSRMFDFWSSTSSVAGAGLPWALPGGPASASRRACSGCRRRRRGPSSPVLADDVVVEEALDLGRRRERDGRAALVALRLLRDDVVAEPDALVADVDGRPGDELANLALALPAEGAAQVSVVVLFAAHASLVRRMLPPNRCPGIPRPAPQHNQRARASPLRMDAPEGRVTRAPPRASRSRREVRGAPRQGVGDRRVVLARRGEPPGERREAREPLGLARRGRRRRRSEPLGQLLVHRGGRRRIREDLVSQLAPALLGQPSGRLRAGEHLDHLERRGLAVAPPATAPAPARGARGTRSWR